MSAAQAYTVVSPYSSPIQSPNDDVGLDWYFPEVDPLHKPLGARVLLQLRRTKNKSAGGIILASETKGTETWNTQVAKVVSIGPLAFRNRSTAELWPEGIWANVGDFVRIPRWGGERWSVDIPGEVDEPAIFLICEDNVIIAKVTGDPLTIRAFIL